MMKRIAPSPELASAMKILRMKAGMSLKEIEPDVGVTRQAISRWENGTANWPSDRIPLYLKAINKTQADLDREIAGLAEDGESGGFPIFDRDLRETLPRGMESLKLADEHMSPWAEPGEVVLFQRGHHPRRMEGCVIERHSGPPLVRIYLRERDGFIFVQRINPESTEQFLHSEIKALHRIVFRGHV